jgi:hypothetical protein
VWGVASYALLLSPIGASICFIVVSRPLLNPRCVHVHETARDVGYLGCFCSCRTQDTTAVIQPVPVPVWPLHFTSYDLSPWRPPCVRCLNPIATLIRPLLQIAALNRPRTTVHSSFMHEFSAETFSIMQFIFGVFYGCYLGLHGSAFWHARHSSTVRWVTDNDREAHLRAHQVLCFAPMRAGV